jgi:hypothetical protein
MRDEHRLGAAQVRVGRHHRVAGGRRLIGEDLDEGLERFLKQRNPPLQIKPQIQRDLLVSRTPGVQPAAGIADPLHQLALDERVHVLVVFCGR